MENGEVKEKPESTDTMMMSAVNPHQSSLMCWDYNHPNNIKITVNTKVLRTMSSQNEKQ